ncbi:epithelial-stromal interaction protein 1 isoform X1 [Denticeps clupeoides]|uniref:CUE domain-containing protein n=1 Tax=Denticeps clupeoides TaxID=299321 RepID=A0AAY4BJ82_9TELE|nr:epithelial-stromal interaction protein 1 isoform X1 [Denticeps clupeoides]
MNNTSGGPTPQGGQQNPAEPEPVPARETTAPVHAAGYTMVTPNESKRSELQRIAQRGEDELKRWKNENRPGPIHLAPERLGGSTSLAETRQRQQIATRHSQFQKKLRKQEMDQQQRLAREEENQKKKAAQREKAVKLEMKTKQEEERRREHYQSDQQVGRERLLRRPERASTVPAAAGGPAPASPWVQAHKYREEQRLRENTQLQQKSEEQRRKAEVMEEKQKQQEEQRARELEEERRRVNLAFLDRLQAAGTGGAVQPPPVTHDALQNQRPQRPETSLMQRPAVTTEGEDADIEWIVMKLLSNFPHCERAFVEDIVLQCNGEYQQVYDLLKE